MTVIAKLAILLVALGAAALAGRAHARRHDHPRFIHHRTGYALVAVLAAAALLIDGPR